LITDISRQPSPHFQPNECRIFSPHYVSAIEIAAFTLSFRQITRHSHYAAYCQYYAAADAATSRQFIIARLSAFAIALLSRWQLLSPRNTPPPAPDFDSEAADASAIDCE